MIDDAKKQNKRYEETGYDSKVIYIKRTNLKEKPSIELIESIKWLKDSPGRSKLTFNHLFPETNNVSHFNDTTSIPDNLRGAYCANLLIKSGLLGDSCFLESENKHKNKILKTKPNLHYMRINYNPPCVTENIKESGQKDPKIASQGEQFFRVLGYVGATNFMGQYKTRAIHESGNNKINSNSSKELDPKTGCYLNVGFYCSPFSIDEHRKTFFTTSSAKLNEFAKTINLNRYLKPSHRKKVKEVYGSYGLLAKGKIKGGGEKVKRGVKSTFVNKNLKQGAKKTFRKIK